MVEEELIDKIIEVYSLLVNNFFFNYKTEHKTDFSIKVLINKFNSKYGKHLNAALLTNKLSFKRMNYLTQEEAFIMLNEFLDYLYAKIKDSADTDCEELFKYSIREFYNNNIELIEELDIKFPEWLDRMLEV